MPNAKTFTGSADLDAMVARIAPAILVLLADGVPRTKAAIAKAFGDFAHVNALQRDMCPSQTKFEGEIIAMTLDLLHADAAEGCEPVGLVTTGGTGSILHAVLAYREWGRQQKGIRAANIIIGPGACASGT